MFDFDLGMGDLALLVTIVLLILTSSYVGRFGNAVGRLFRGPPRQ